MTNSFQEVDYWQTLYDRFIAMDDEAWEKVDRRLVSERSPEEIEKIHEDFVTFTRFVWSNFIDLKLDFNDPVISRILDARGGDALKTIGVKEDNLNALRPDLA